jgi:ribosome-binding factor A
MNYRKERLGSLLRGELNKIIVREIEIPNTIITITRVEVAEDLDRIKIGISTIPSEKTAEALKTLTHQKKHFAHLLLKKTRLRTIPELVFEIDHGSENAAVVEKRLLDEGLI